MITAIRLLHSTVHGIDNDRDIDIQRHDHAGRPVEGVDDVPNPERPRAAQKSAVMTPANRMSPDRPEPQPPARPARRWPSVRRCWSSARWARLWNELSRSFNGSNAAVANRVSATAKTMTSSTAPARPEAPLRHRPPLPTPPVEAAGQKTNNAPSQGRPDNDARQRKQDEQSNPAPTVIAVPIASPANLRQVAGGQRRLRRGSKPLIGQSLRQFPEPANAAP